MQRNKITIGLVFGGKSAEHDISITSARSVYAHLDKDKYKIVCIYINLLGRWGIVDSPLLEKHELNKSSFQPFLPWGSRSSKLPDEISIYFPVLHGPFGEDGTIQGLFEMAGVPYVGAGVLSSSLCMDKAMAKILFRAGGLPVAPFVSFNAKEWRKSRDAVQNRIRSDLRLPLFVKPANLGSSVGITKVKDDRDVPEAVKTALCYDGKVIVEQGVEGRELECSVLGNDEPRASLPGEILPYRDFYDYRDKYVEGKTQFKIPAPLTPEMTHTVKDMAVKAYKVLDCAGMARVDFFLEDKSGTLFLNEINTIPGFTEISMYPKLWEASGILFPELLDNLIDLAFSRQKNRMEQNHKKP